MHELREITCVCIDTFFLSVLLVLSLLSSSLSHISIHTLYHGLVVSNLSVHGVAQVQCIYRVKSYLVATCDLGDAKSVIHIFIYTLLKDMEAVPPV